MHRMSTQRWLMLHTLLSQRRWPPSTSTCQLHVLLLLLALPSKHFHMCVTQCLPYVSSLQPSATHFYQPLWTLVGGGFKDVKDSMRPMADVMPEGVDWLQTGVAGFDPDSNSVTTADGRTVKYDFMVVVSEVLGGLEVVARTPKDYYSRGCCWCYISQCLHASWCGLALKLFTLHCSHHGEPRHIQFNMVYALQATGIQAKWERVKGLPKWLGDGHVVSNMNVGTAPLTFQAVQGLKEGHAVFTMPKGVIKCPGAGQKVQQFDCLYHLYPATLKSLTALAKC